MRVPDDDGHRAFTHVTPFFMGALGQWWTLGLLGIGLLFMLLSVCYLMSRRSIHAEEAYLAAHGDPDLNHQNSGQQEPGALEFNALSTPVVRIQKRHRFWSAWATRIFVTIVLSCAGVYMGSKFSGAASPSWLGFALQAFIYGSAFLFYKTWRRTTAEEE